MVRDIIIYFLGFFTVPLFMVGVAILSVHYDHRDQQQQLNTTLPED